MRLYTMNAANWTDRYPAIVKEAARIKGEAIIDAEVVFLGPDGASDFDKLAVACAFDLLSLNGEDLRRNPLSERKAALRTLLRRSIRSAPFKRRYSIRRPC